MQETVESCLQICDGASFVRAALGSQDALTLTASDKPKAANKNTTRAKQVFAETKPKTVTSNLRFWFHFSRLALLQLLWLCLACARVECFSAFVLCVCCLLFAARVLFGAKIALHRDSSSQFAEIAAGAQNEVTAKRRRIRIGRSLARLSRRVVACRMIDVAPKSESRTNPSSRPQLAAKPFAFPLNFGAREIVCVLRI